MKKLTALILLLFLTGCIWQSGPAEDEEGKQGPDNQQEIDDAKSTPGFYKYSGQREILEMCAEQPEAVMCDCVMRPTTTKGCKGYKGDENVNSE